MQKNSIAKNAIFNVLYKVLNVLFPLISTSYVSRVLLSDGVGRVAAVNNNVSYFLILATLGIPAYGLREIAKNRDDKQTISKIFSELFTINCILTFLSFFIYCIFVLFVSYFQNERLLYIIYGGSILLNLINADWLFQGLEEYQYIAIRSTVIKIISLILIFLFVREKKDLYFYAIINVLAIGGNNVFNIIKSRSIAKIGFYGLDLKKHLSPLIYLALCTISTELYARMDITMLDVMKGSSAVGYYTSSHKIINLIIVTLVAVTTVFLPRLSYSFEKNKEEFNKVLKIGLDLMITVSFPAFVAIYIISKPLVLTLLGSDFDAATSTMAILSLMIPLKCIGDLICYQVMMCARKESILMWSYVITMVINFVNNLIMIPRYGATGAAVASVLSEVFAFVFVFWFSRKLIQFTGVGKLICKTLIATLIMAVSIIVVRLVDLNNYVELVFDVIFGVAVFVITCFVIKHDVVIEYIGLLKAKIRKQN